MGVARRFVKFGGALGDAQMAWLRTELHEAAGLGEHVIVCCHLVRHLGFQGLILGEHVIVCCS